MRSGERIGERVGKSFLEVRVFLALRRFLFGGCLRETLDWFWFWWCLDAVIRRGWWFWCWRNKVGVRWRKRESEVGIGIGGASCM